MSVSVFLLISALFWSQYGLSDLFTFIFPIGAVVSAEAEEPSQDIPDIFSEGEFVEDDEAAETKTESADRETGDEKQGALVRAGELDEWSGPWRGTLKTSLIKADGKKKSGSEVISEMEAHYLKKKKLRAEAEERKRTQEQAGEGDDAGGIADIPAAVAEAAMEAISEAMDIVFISVFDVAEKGVPIGFSLRKLDEGYKFYIPGIPAESEKELDGIPIFIVEDKNTLHARFIDTENTSVYDLRLVSNRDKSALDATVSVESTGIKNHEKSSLYDSFEIVFKGKFDRGDYSYEEFKEKFEGSIVMTMEEYDKKLNPKEEDE